MDVQEQSTIQHKLDALVSYGGGGTLALASWLANLATIAQQVGMIIGCAVMAFKLYRDIEKYIGDKKAGKQNGAGKDTPSQDEGG